MIALAIPTYTRFDLCARCVETALAGTVAPDRIIVVDNSGGACPPIRGAEIILGRQPQSVAKAWNDAVRLVGGDLILSNDDITLAPDTIERMLAEAEHNDRSGIVSAIEGHKFSLFWLRHRAYLDMGGFDEGYTSAYFEDNHAARVLTLCGWELVVAPSAVKHVGSATIATYDRARKEQHHREFRANRARYVALWGGPPDGERYTVPHV